LFTWLSSCLNALLDLVAFFFTPLLCRLAFNYSIPSHIHFHLFNVYSPDYSLLKGRGHARALPSPFPPHTVLGKEQSFSVWSGITQTGVCIFALPPTSCVTLGKLWNLFEPASSPVRE